MMEHLIISSETDREAEREVRERKIVVEKRSVDEMILVYLCVCRVCVWGLIRMPPVTRNTNEQNCRKKWTANERNLWLRRTHNPSETLKSLSVSVLGLTPRFVCQRELAEGRAVSSLTLAGCSSVHFEVCYARFKESKNRKIKYSLACLIYYMYFFFFSFLLFC